MKIEVEFDNYDADEDSYTALSAVDVVLKLKGWSIVPVSMFAGRHATYELPEGASEEDLIEALETCNWSYTGLTEVGPEGPGM